VRCNVPPANARTTRSDDDGTAVFSAPGANVTSDARALAFSAATLMVAFAAAFPALAGRRW
jgi:hypothetical protein